MHNLKKILIVPILAISLVASAFAADNFVVSAIKIQGLQRIKQSTVLNYVPITTGKTLTADKTGQIIKNLYKTGFFSDVKLSRAGNTLVINVVERATIGNIKVSGNKDIDKDKLNSVLKDVGLVEGRVFDRSVLEKIKNSLQTEYHNRGRYNARVSTKVTAEERNRVSVAINISEGRVALIKQITIIGNKAFTSKALISELTLQTPGLLTWFTRNDQYSKEKLDKSLEAITGYYMDRGYLKFKVDSAQVSLTPDKKDAYLVIRVTENAQYKIKDFKFAGNLIVTEKQLRDVVTLKAGDLVSRKQIMKSSTAVSRILGNHGYVFANVNAVPDIDEKNKLATLTFYVDPGQRAYVRRIGFIGNVKTSDEVLRRQVVQNEGGLADLSKIKESKRRINMLGYIQDAKLNTLPVSGSNDQIDLQYQVNETPSAEARVGLGYGTDGLVYNLSVNQANFLGNGKSIRVAFDNSPFTRTYSMNYNNPYYTKEGIQRGFSFYSQRFTPGRVNLTSAYTYDTYGGSVNYSIPINAKFDSVQFSFGYQHTNLNLGSNPSVEVTRFLKEKGNNSFNQLLVSTGWSRNSFDRAIFPTRGGMQNISGQLSLPSGGTALKYYKVSYDMRWYHPLSQYFTFTSQAGASYGSGYGSDKRLPFFQNFYAGGIGTTGAVRGYASNSLGPSDSQGNPIGGNALLYGNMGVVFPSLISDKVRTTMFVDAGNVYNTRPYSPEPKAPANQHSGSLRYAAGLAVDWQMPMLGILNFSVAKALNPRSAINGFPADQTQFFQFTFGTAF